MIMESLLAKYSLFTSKRYWTVLKGGRMIFYKDSDKAVCHGDIKVCKVQSVKPSNAKGFCIEIVLESKTQLFSAASSELRDKWVECLREAMATEPRTPLSRQGSIWSSFDDDDSAFRLPASPSSSSLEQSSGDISKTAFWSNHKSLNQNESSSSIDEIMSTSSQSSGGMSSANSSSAYFKYPSVGEPPMSPSSDSTDQPAGSVISPQSRVAEQRASSRLSHGSVLRRRQQRASRDVEPAAHIPFVEVVLDSSFEPSSIGLSELKHSRVELDSDSSFNEIRLFLAKFQSHHSGEAACGSLSVKHSSEQTGLAIERLKFFLQNL